MFEKTLKERLRIHSRTTEHLSHMHTFKKFKQALKNDAKAIKNSHFIKMFLHTPTLFKNM